MAKKTEQVIIYTDGGSRGNPGPAAAGFVIMDNNANTLVARGLFLGETTNNVAEYTAVVNALTAAKELDAGQVKLFADSQLLVRQLNGQYKVKSRNLKDLYKQSMQLLCFFDSWQVTHISRDKNTAADRLVNLAIDKKAAIDKTPKRGKKPVKTTPQSQIKKPVRIGALISGGGRTLLNILELIKAGQLNAEVVLVISSRSTVAGVEKAEKAGLNVKIIRKKDFPDIDEFSKQIEEQLVAAKVDLVIQAGWLCLWKIPARYESRVMNIHPALLPSFGGKGMWGHYVHEAVLKQGCKISGCTVHFCTNEYDKGQIIVQCCCPVEDDDTPDTLAARVFKQECIAYPQAIKLFSEGKLCVQDGRARTK